MLINEIENQELSKSQQEVLDSFLEGKNIFVTGSAGSGKSYLLNFLKRKFSHYGLVITASTGIAAVNIGGVTIHSWSGIGLANLPVEEIVKNIISNKFSKIRRNIMNAKALAIDEISMISADIFELLDLVLRKVRNNDQPFGGLQIILFGDFLQLPPVANFNNFKFAFDSYSWSELNLKYFNLREAFRSQNKNFTKLLDNLRIGELSQENKDDLLKRLNIKDENEAIKPTILTTHNYKVDKINEYFLKQIPEKEVVFEADYFGDKYKIEFLKKNSLAAQKLKLKLGAQVMMTKNTYQKEGIINGSLGIICGFTTRKSFPIVEFANGKKITIATSEWAIERFDEETQEVKVEAGVVQIPLILAWAITIHKSQGLTLDKISCDLSDIFSPGQAYVALSRARNLESIYLQSINFNKITAHQEAVNFYKNI